MIIPLGPRLPGASSDLPGSLGGPPSNAPLFGLAPGGVFQAGGVATAAGELLPHLFTLTVDVPRRSGLCGTFPGVAPAGDYPAPCPVELGLSSGRPKAAGDHPACSATLWGLQSGRGYSLA